MLTQSDLDAIETVIDAKLDEKLNHLPTKEEFYENHGESHGELKAIEKSRQLWLIACLTRRSSLVT